jgi:hypothetical protein
MFYLINISGMYKQINFEYDKNILLDIFENNPKEIVNSHFTKTKYLINEDKILESFYKKFDFIPLDRDSVELFELTSAVNPHVNPRNNGLIFFPVQGLIEYTFYNYIPELVNGRPKLDPGTVLDGTELHSKINSTLVDKKIVLKPMIINGLITHSYRPLVRPSKVLVLKIPTHVNWNNLELT